MKLSQVVALEEEFEQPQPVDSTVNLNIGETLNTPHQPENKDQSLNADVDEDYLFAAHNNGLPNDPGPAATEEIQEVPMPGEGVLLDTKEEEQLFADTNAALEDLCYLLEDIRNSSGISQSHALEAERLMPGFLQHAPVGYYTKQPSATRLRPATESIVSTIWEHIKAFFKKLVEYVKKAWQWVTSSSEDLTESKLNDLLASNKQFASEAGYTLDAFKKTSRKKKQGKSAATEDASSLSHLEPMAVLNSEAEKLNGKFETSLATAEKLVLFSDPYVSDIEQLARGFARKNPIEHLMKKYHGLRDSVFELCEQAKAKVDSIDDFSERREAFEKFKENLGAELKRIDPDSWQDSAKELSEDIVRFHGARKETDNEYLSKGVEIIARPDQLIGRVATRDHAFMAIKSVVTQVKFTTDELKKLDEIFGDLVKKTEAMERGTGSKHHEAQSYAAQCLLTEAHQAISQIKTISQGIGIFPLYFHDSHRAVLKLQKHVLEIYGSALRILEDNDEFDTDLIRTQYEKLRQQHNRFAAVRTK